MKTSKNKTVLIILLLSMLSVLSACHNEKKSGAGPGGPQGPMPYKVVSVYSGSATMYYTFPASIQGEEDIDIRPKVDGFIEKIFVAEGAAVQKGQLLFQLRNPQYDAALRSAIASVKIAEADVNTAQMNIEKVRPLVDKKIISDYELKSDQYTLQSKEASLASARADVVNAQVNVGYTYITSPASGVIGTIPYKTGSLITGSSTNPLTTLYNTKNIYAYFSLNEKQFLSFLNRVKGKTLKDKLASGADVSLILADGSEYPQKGRILTTSGAISTTTGSINLRANFANPYRLIRSGSSATIKIPVNIDTAILIPQEATYDLQGKKFVYTLDDKNMLVNTPVELSENTIGNLYLVQSGLKTNAKIVIEGVGNLKPGIAIKPVPANADSVYAQAKTPGATTKALKHN